jgi:integration host factor subunit beta
MMEKKTFVKKELIQEMQSKYPKILNAEIEKVVENIFKYLSNQLASGHNIEIRGFGMLKTKITKPRIAHNPKTGASVEVPSKRKVSWKSSKLLNLTINQESKVIDKE